MNDSLISLTNHYKDEVVRALCILSAGAKDGVFRPKWLNDVNAGIAQLARASAFQAEGRGFESRFPLQI